GNARRLFKLARGVYRICDISDAPVSVQAIDKFAEMLIH
ncbi:TPA: ATPase, partial [Escherichia coli]|nr:ATPase [Escherichia coli]